MTDLPFGLESQRTYAALNPSDLQSLGKQASVEYLSGRSSLNDAIIKLARSYPSISRHQVQRVIEFANQETFARLFADNEKYASDKNIEFPIADPEVVLLELNNGAAPHTITSAPGDYSSSPMKLAHRDVEADAVLAELFLGVEPVLPGVEKLASSHEDNAVDHILAELRDDMKPTPSFGPASIDRILGLQKEAAIAPGMAPQPGIEVQPQEEGGGEGGGGESYNQQMLELQREIELAKKRQELQKIQQQTLDTMNPQGQPGEVQAPAPAAPDAGAAAAPAEAAQASAPVEAAPPQEELIPPPSEGAIAVPPGSEPIKSASLVKQAMDYVKASRPRTDLALGALQLSTSLDSIKKMASERGHYPMANPYGEVIRSKQKLSCLLDEAVDAVSKMETLNKEARESFQDEVVNFMWDSGNFGEVAHLLSALPAEPSHIKSAMALAVDTLSKKGMNLREIQAGAIQYEMEKGASRRPPNTEHPIAVAFMAMEKTAHSLELLAEAKNQLCSQYNLVDNAIQEAARHAAPC
jgi:hypothetical protein